MAKSARRQFNWELPDNTPLRIPHIPGGKKSKKGGMNMMDSAAALLGPDMMKLGNYIGLGKKKKMHGGQIGDEMVPPEHAIELSGGIQMNDGRGNIIETDEAIKGGKRKAGRPKKGGNILDTLGQIAQTAVPFLPYLALGKKKAGRPKKGAGIESKPAEDFEPANNSFVGVKSAHGKKKKGGDFGDVIEDLMGLGKIKKGGDFGDVIEDLMALGKKKKGGNIISDVVNDIGDIMAYGKKGKPSKKGGNVLGDIVGTVGSLFGLGKKKKGGINMTMMPTNMTNPYEEPNPTSGGKRLAKAKRTAQKDEMMKSIESLEAGIKHLKKSAKKMK